ncbi:MAG: hypothetical protein ABH832_04615 [bacterium]
MMSIKLPNNSVKYILFQRTGYLRNNFIFKLLTLLGSYKFCHNLSINLRSFLFSSKIKTKYIEDLELEYDIIKKKLPQTANSILDIGCGVAAIDVLISKHYGNNINIFLIDKTKIDDKVHYDFKEKSSFYNSLQISKQILEANCIDSKKIHAQEATASNDISFEANFDIVISLISWGFHYPISTYLDNVYKKMNHNGIMIVDVRKNSGGEKEIKKIFGGYEIILDTNKLTRVLAKKIINA